MMGEDWREFRANLVARERSSATSSAAGSDNSSEKNMNVSDTKKQQQQQQKLSSWQQQQQSSTVKEETTGGIFSAISSMFSKGGSSSSSGSDSSSTTTNNKERARTLAEQVDAATTTRARKTKKTTSNDPSTRGGGDIFDGYSVGGATKFSTIGVSSSSSSTSSSSSSTSPCSDPFMDEEECALIYNESDVKLDKHRWAHPLFHVEPGCILVANERLGGVFHQTVVLIIDHNSAAGSTGMVINRYRISMQLFCVSIIILFSTYSFSLTLSKTFCFYRPFPGNLMKIASDGDSNIDLSLKTAFSKAPVAYGGPVMQDQFSTLHGYGEVMGSKKVCPGVFVGGSTQLIQEVRRNSISATDVLFVKGHAAWVPGQLTREIDKGVWYVAAASADFILRYAGAPVLKDDNDADLWADILSCMGDEFVTIANAHSGRGDQRMLP
jgi:putative transcriptional regulator